MAYFRLSSRVRIGGFVFSGVHDLRIKRSMKHYTETAIIRIPSLCKLGTDTALKTTGTFFKEGDAVKIELGYNENYVTEFEGFVKRQNMGMPLEIECEGYVRELRLKGKFSKYFSETSIKQLCDAFLASKEASAITVKVANDMPLVKIRCTGATGIEVLDAIKRISNGILNIFFVDFKTLWIGLIYAPLSTGTDVFKMGRVKYRLGYNTVKDNDLKERILEGEPVVIRGVTTKATGERVATEAQDVTAKRREQAVFNNIQDLKSMGKLVNEKQLLVNYSGFEGRLTGFLEPYCAPGWIAEIQDDRYPKKNGSYIVEGTEVVFGQGGARRIVEIGPKVGFKTV